MDLLHTDAFLTESCVPALPIGAELRFELARLAQSVERETLNLKVVGSTPTSGSIPGGE